MRKSQKKELLERFELKYLQKTWVIIRTLGSTRGDNSMRDCDTVIFTGLIHKGELNYLSESMVLNEDYAMDLNVRKHRRVRKFIDRNTEIVKLSSWLEEFVQEVYRTRLRSHNLNQDVYAYLMVSDPDFLNLIEGYFVGCKMEEWYPVETIKDNLPESALDLITKIETQLRLGQTSIKKGSLGIDSKILTQTLNRYSEIREILNQMGIEVTTRTFKLKNPSITI